MSDGSEKRPFNRTLWAGETRVSDSQPGKRLWLNNLQTTSRSAPFQGRAGFVAMAKFFGVCNKSIAMAVVGSHRVTISSATVPWIENTGSFVAAALTRNWLNWAV